MLNKNKKFESHNLKPSTVIEALDSFAMPSGVSQSYTIII